MSQITSKKLSINLTQYNAMFINLIFGFAFFTLGFVAGTLIWGNLAFKTNRLNKEMLRSLDGALTGWKESIDFINAIVPHLTGEQMLKIGEELFTKHNDNQKKHDNTE